MRPSAFVSGSAGYAPFGFLLHVDCGQSIFSYNFGALVQSPEDTKIVPAPGALQIPRS
jgi:hypothetical protein